MGSSLTWTGKARGAIGCGFILGLLSLALPAWAETEPKTELEEAFSDPNLQRMPRPIEGFHLAVGFSGALLQMRSEKNFYYAYRGGSFFSAANYHVGRWALGVKSSAYLGIENRNRRKVKSVPALTMTDHVQYVSFSPHVHYYFSQGMFVSVGFASSQTGISRSTEYVEEYGRVKRKVTLQGKGIDLTVGYALPRQSGETPSFIFFDYQDSVPERQRLVDITDDTEVETIDRSQDPEIMRVRFYSISYGAYLF